MTSLDYRHSIFQTTIWGAFAIFSLISAAGYYLSNLWTSLGFFIIALVFFWQAFRSLLVKAATVTDNGFVAIYVFNRTISGSNHLIKFDTISSATLILEWVKGNLRGGYYRVRMTIHLLDGKNYDFSWRDISLESAHNFEAVLKSKISSLGFKIKQPKGSKKKF